MKNFYGNMLRGFAYAFGARIAWSLYNLLSRLVKWALLAWGATAFIHTLTTQATATPATPAAPTHHAAR